MITIPGVGPVKPAYVYGGAAAIGVLVIYVYWRSSQAGSGDEVEDGDAETEVPAGTDVPAEADYAYALGAGGYDYGGATSYPSYISPNYGAQVPSGAPVTNADWAQKAREQLEGEGVDSSKASSAIGTYLARLCLSADQADLARRATAMLGAPPQGTFSIVTCPGNPVPPKPTTPKPTTPSGPKYAGKVSGLRVSKTSKSSISVDWQPAAHSEGYVVTVGGRKLTPRYSSVTVSGLRKNTKYTISVTPIPDRGYKAPAASKITARTRK